MASPLVAALVRAQQAANLSNRRLAALLGVSPSAISHYVSGASTPSLDVLTRWAEAVDVRLAVVEQHAGAVAELATRRVQERDEACRAISRRVRGGNVDEPSMVWY